MPSSNIGWTYILFSLVLATMLVMAAGIFGPWGFLLAWLAFGVATAAATRTHRWQYGKPRLTTLVLLGPLVMAIAVGDALSYASVKRR
jgi:predicted Co/Zn/Cd cation transporter (cation efflux family)